MKLTAPLPIKFAQCYISFRVYRWPPHGRLPARMSVAKFTSPSEAFTNPLNRSKMLCFPNHSCASSALLEGIRFVLWAAVHSKPGKGAPWHCPGALGSDGAVHVLPFPLKHASSTCLPINQRFLPPHARQVAQQPAGPPQERASMRRAFASSQGFKKDQEMCPRLGRNREKSIKLSSGHNAFFCNLCSVSLVNIPKKSCEPRCPLPHG